MYLQTANNVKSENPQILPSSNQGFSTFSQTYVHNLELDLSPVKGRESRGSPLVSNIVNVRNSLRTVTPSAVLDINYSHLQPLCRLTSIYHDLDHARAIIDC